MYLGVAQLVARYLGVVEAAGSSPVTQTISSIHKGFDFMNARFFLICYYASGLLNTWFYGDSSKSQILPAADTILNKCDGCDIFICGRHKINDLKVEFEAYKPIETERVSKKPTNDPNEYDACNKRYADELFSIVERSL